MPLPPRVSALPILTLRLTAEEATALNEAAAALRSNPSALVQSGIVDAAQRLGLSPSTSATAPSPPSTWTDAPRRSTAAVAATVATAAAAVAAAESATVACALGTGAGFVHHEVTAMEGDAVGAFDRGTPAVVVGHLHETEAAAPVGGLVHDDLGRGHLTVSFKKLAEILVLCGIRNVGDVNVHEFD